MTSSIKFRANIKKENIVIQFTLEDIVAQDSYYHSIIGLLRPWLQAGNIPDRFIGEKDRNGQEIYENDKVRFFTDKSHMTPAHIDGKINFSNGNFWIDQLTEAKFRFKDSKTGVIEESTEFDLKFYSYDGPEFSWEELEVISE